MDYPGVAGKFRIQAQLPIHVPKQWVPPPHAFGDQLQPDRPMVESAQMGQLVNDDAAKTTRRQALG